MGIDGLRNHLINKTSNMKARTVCHPTCLDDVAQQTILPIYICVDVQSL